MVWLLLGVDCGWLIADLQGCFHGSVIVMGLIVDC
jgi:hypothetical protein